MNWRRKGSFLNKLPLPASKDQKTRRRRMTREVIYLLLGAMVCVAPAARAADPPRFEGAEIRSSVPGTSIRDSFMQGPFVGGGRFEIRKATIVDLVRLGW